MWSASITPIATQPPPFASRTALVLSAVITSTVRPLMMPVTTTVTLALSRYYCEFINRRVPFAHDCPLTLDAARVCSGHVVSGQVSSAQRATPNAPRQPYFQLLSLNCQPSQVSSVPSSAFQSNLILDQCRSSLSCAMNSKVCDKINARCVECNEDRDCPSSARYCRSDKTCSACRTNSDCPRSSAACDNTCDSKKKRVRIISV